MVYSTATHNEIQVNYGYVSLRPRIIFNPPKLGNIGKWTGGKTIHKIAIDRKSYEWKMWTNTDPSDRGGGPRNNNILKDEF